MPATKRSKQLLDLVNTGTIIKEAVNNITQPNVRPLLQITMYMNQDKC